VTDYAAEVAAAVAPEFSGVVAVSNADGVLFEQGYGFADRAHEVRCTWTICRRWTASRRSSPPVRGFGYCNSGYVVLALIAERVAGRGYHELVHDWVLKPAGMTRTRFLRSDRLPGDAAIGYLADGRTNVFALPVRGNGDGGIYTTLADMRRFWAALFAGRIVAPEWVDQMTSPQSADPPAHRYDYGFGFWLDGPAVVLDGGDHGVSFRSVFDRSSGTCWTVIANLETPIIPLVSRLRDLVR
jgi:CubicO group peptidase (beta-lactamase class C family)